VTGDARQASVEHRLRTAEQAFQAVLALRQLDLRLDALSRLYFAAFHWMKALLSWENVEAKSHRGVHTLVGLHFIVPGRLEPAHQQTFSRLETWRDKADYQEGFTVDRELLDTEIAACEVLRDRILMLLSEAGFSRRSTP
jgi:uncharacterized protein (UPF0332 family)